MSILNIKDENGNWISVPAIKGDKGPKGDKGDPGLTSEEIKAVIAHDAVLKSEIGENNTVAEGVSQCLAIGEDNTINTPKSLIVGKANTISIGHTGAYAFAIGENNSIESPYGGIAFGKRNSVTNTSGIALGNDNQVKGSLAIAIGSRSEASGNYAVAIGGHTTNSLDPQNVYGNYWHNIAEGWDSAAIGSACYAKSNYSFASGLKCQSLNSGAAVFGIGNVSTMAGSFVCGRSNNPNPDYDGEDSSLMDMFEVGNGTWNGAINTADTPDMHSNAFRVRRDGVAFAQTALGIGSTTFTESDIEAWNNKSGVFREMSISEYEALEDKSGWFLVYGD